MTIIKKQYDKGNSVYNSIVDDCGSILKMYSMTSEYDDSDPEDNLSSPFAELGLIKRSDRERSCYTKTRPVYDKLDKLVVLKKRKSTETVCGCVLHML